MAGNFSIAEKVEMVKMHYLVGENFAAATRRFNERFPNNTVSRQSLTTIVRRFEATGSVANAKRNKPVDRAIQEFIIGCFIINPHTSVRTVAFQTGLSKSKIWTILNTNAMHPYHVCLHQGLKDRDEQRRLDFCNWLLLASNEQVEFLRRIIFSDEANFPRDGPVNLHNNHWWALGNPHYHMANSHQERFSVNVWIGILDNHLIGPFFLPLRQAGRDYLLFLTETIIPFMEDLPLRVAANVWFQQDGAPPHNTQLVAQLLNREFPHQWIGTNGPVAWPARSPDLSPLDFFVWGFIKDKVYSSPVPDVDTLRNRIMRAAQEIDNQMLNNSLQNLLQRARACIAVEGKVFEPFL